MSVVLAITGASGAAYAVRLLEMLLAAGREVHLTISPAGQAVIEHELGLKVNLDAFRISDLFRDERRVSSSKGTIRYHHHQDVMAPIASGSFLTHGMVVCPCSGGTLAAIAHALGTNLIHRAAEVHLKERRKLILVPRETPLSLPQLDNMKRATEAGAVVLPASPGFYHGPMSISDLVDFVVARICDQLRVEHSLMRRWGAEDMTNV
jgi:4-hydroxy-3-polyprenylbenzoate decarboxylase